MTLQGNNISQYTSWFYCSFWTGGRTDLEKWTGKDYQPLLIHNKVSELRDAERRKNIKLVFLISTICYLIPKGHPWKHTYK